MPNKIVELLILPHSQMVVRQTVREVPLLTYGSPQQMTLLGQILVVPMLLLMILEVPALIPTLEEEHTDVLPVVFSIQVHCLLT